ncbi:hypothetical protein J6590_004821 [Homalodisca vitripennis]|nr:hypothetical protein J6590_004821 [Homalodisca vitripennis]
MTTVCVWSDTASSRDVGHQVPPAAVVFTLLCHYGRGPETVFKVQCTHTLPSLIIWSGIDFDQPSSTPRRPDTSPPTNHHIHAVLITPAPVAQRHVAWDCLLIPRIPLSRVHASITSLTDTVSSHSALHTSNCNTVFYFSAASRLAARRLGLLADSSHSPQSSARVHYLTD